MFWLETVNAYNGNAVLSSLWFVLVWLFECSMIYIMSNYIHCAVCGMTVTNWGAPKSRSFGQGAEPEDPSQWGGGSSATVDGGAAWVSRCWVWPAATLTCEQCQIPFSLQRKLWAPALCSVCVGGGGGEMLVKNCLGGKSGVSFLLLVGEGGMTKNCTRIKLSLAAHLYWQLCVCVHFNCFCQLTSPSVTHLQWISYVKNQS